MAKTRRMAGLIALGETLARGSGSAGVVEARRDAMADGAREDTSPAEERPALAASY